MRKLTSANAHNQQELISNCPLTSTLLLINGRWKLVIIWHLNKGACRFGELNRAIPLVTEKMLTDQLRELERDGFVARTVFAQVPPRVEYQLTPLATSLVPILEQLLVWGETNEAVARVQQGRFEGSTTRVR